MVLPIVALVFIIIRGSILGVVGTITVAIP